MKEIKFRQWQPDTKTFLYIHQVQAGAPLKAENILHDGELQQYTGRKDKNDKEIYEGDIVKSDWQHDGVKNYDYEVIGEIRFNKDYLQFLITVDEGEQINYHPLCSFEREELDEESIEIIGNVQQGYKLY